MFALKKKRKEEEKKNGVHVNLSLSRREQPGEVFKIRDGRSDFVVISFCSTIQSKHFDLSLLANFFLFLDIFFFFFYLKARWLHTQREKVAF